MSLPAIVVLLILFALAVPTLLRANEVCAISVRDGRLLVLRGRAPVQLLADIREVVERAAVAWASIRIVKEGGAARLVAVGVDEPTAQRLRNVLGAYPYKMFARAPSAKRRNLGQLLGIPSLAWRLHDRDSSQSLK